MSTHNQVGKLKIQCSCGTKAALNEYEIQDWLMRHSATNPTIKHNLDIGSSIGVDEQW